MPAPLGTRCPGVCRFDWREADPMRRELAVPIGLAAVTAIAHLLTAQDPLGIFRDELYYVACARHLDWGFVDQPPLTALVTRISIAVLGSSLFALRVLPALAGGGAVFFAAMIAREMGGDRFAQALTGAVSALAPVYVALFGYLSMNAYDVLIWSALVFVAARTLRTGDTRGWIAFGALAGIGLQNKISVLFLGFGIAVGLVFGRDWRQLRSPRLWIGGALAGALFAPYVVWNAAHGFPTLTFMHNATQFKNMPLSPVAFLAEQALQMNPLVAPLAIAGLVWLIVAKSARPWRAIGWAFLAILSLLIFQRAKAYYLSPAYSLVLPAGAVVLERVTRGRIGAWVRVGAVTAVVGTGLFLAPLGKSLLSADGLVAHMERVGIAPSPMERQEMGRLPQFFADRLGWSELAETVGDVTSSLSPGERERVCVFGQNYGHAGAIDYHRESFDLPPAISGHNSYHLWGPGECTGDVMIVIHGERERLLELFEDVELAATFRCDDCMPYEGEKPIWVCRGMRMPVSELWPRIGNYG